MDAPNSFVREWGRRQVRNQPGRRSLVCKDPLEQAAECIRNQFDNLVARIVKVKEHAGDDRGSIYSLSIAFAEPQECCYRLVRFLERRAAQKGVHGHNRPVASAAA